MPRPAVEAAAVRISPSPDAEQVATLEPGAIFAVLEFAGGWAWGFVEQGHLVGYVAASVLGESAP
jgi:Bacterial SH3 domain